MQYKKLGNTGLIVSQLCMGTMTFGGGTEGIWSAIGNVQQDDVDAMVRHAFDAGINFFDTANVYSTGRAEEMLGQAIRNLGLARDQLVIATKVLAPVGTGPNQRGLSRYHIMDAVKASLKRLQLDHIDLYQAHGVDFMTPIEETMEALDTLVRHGHVRYIGVSNWAAWQIAKANGISARLNLARFASLQAHYTVAGRDPERELVPMLRSEGMGMMVWGPLAGGLLSGKFALGENIPGETRRSGVDFPPVDRDRASRLIDAMRSIAEAKGVSVAQIALAWLLHQPVVTSVIVGAKRMDQLTDNIASTQVVLSSDELEGLDGISKLPEEYPGWMFEMQGHYRQ
ncbi:MAG: aldo/keto reductase [Sphingomonas sp.]|nr:aldo/keto reductase [Sphingomonas sp.]